ncbi:DUF1499 domain-containing protein [Synechococcus sp. PCC 7502]|uniref:DUF1499 domain-containing protein n=1 Tax=Synechococcus sp. PCC 7502 TaxID=1173263 RepID=UPI003528D8DC
MTIVSLFLVAIACLYLFWSSGDQPLFALTGVTPTNLGINDNKLAACPSSPNCVSSQAIDPQHYIAPIQYQSSNPEAYSKLKQLVESQKRTQIIAQTDNYIYAQTTSRLMGFVDDVEFYFRPDTQLIEVRSASRLGESDLGVNRQRIEQIRLKFHGLN